MQFSILFWNIWLDNQMHGKTQTMKLLNGLERIIEQYQPDCIGLNEVLRNAESSSPFVLDFLKKYDYNNNYYAPAYSIMDNWLIGSALSSRLVLDSPQNITLGKNRLAKKEEYTGRSVKAIATKIVLPNNKKVGLVVTHPLCLFPRNLIVHYQATYNLRRLLRTDEFSKDTIIGGDFNEPSFMPRSFKNTTSKILNFKTGNIARPTWKFNASHLTPIRANLDQLYWTKKGSLQLTDFEIIDSDTSDHRPLLATFEV